MNRFRVVEATLNAELSIPYAYCSADCFHLGCSMIDALTGSRLVAKYAGCYRTLPGAQRALRRRGHKSLVTLLAKHLPQIPPAEARIGDVVVLLLADGAEHCGICLGGRFVTKTETGRSDHLLSDCIAAFRVG